MLKSNLIIENRFQITGHVFSHLKRSCSPSGIEHCQFYLEHRSTQIEAGFSRQVWCRIKVSLSGEQLIKQSHSITVGSNLFIVGFITMHKNKDGLNQLVLHAKQIEFID